MASQIFLGAPFTSTVEAKTLVLLFLGLFTVSLDNTAQECSWVFVT